jgi:thiopurine S-methyltransferase
MQADYWHNLWDKKEIGWHLEDTNRLLVKHFSKLKLKKESRVFVPLCGKTVDIKWLLQQGYRVVGVELNKTAVEELFKYLQLEVSIKEVGSLSLYSADNIDIFLGDIFELNKKLLGRVDATYDRGAIVALPPKMRKRYTVLISKITDRANQLLISFDYDQSSMDGPPFSVGKTLLSTYYSDLYKITLLETITIDNFGFDIDENIWLLEKDSI